MTLRWSSRQHCKVRKAAHDGAHRIGKVGKEDSECRLAVSTREPNLVVSRSKAATTRRSGRVGPEAALLAEREFPVTVPTRVLPGPHAVEASLALAVVARTEVLNMRSALAHVTVDARTGTPARVT
jgi:hypothetical protein